MRYLGDTLGTMDTAEEGPFNQSQHPWYRPRTVALPLPLVAYRGGELTIDASAMRSTCNIGTLHPIPVISVTFLLHPIPVAFLLHLCHIYVTSLQSLCV